VSAINFVDSSNILPAFLMSHSSAPSATNLFCFRCRASASLRYNPFSFVRRFVTPDLILSWRRIDAASFILNMIVMVEQAMNYVTNPYSNMQNTIYRTVNAAWA